MPGVIPDTKKGQPRPNPTVVSKTRIGATDYNFGNMLTDFVDNWWNDNKKLVTTFVQNAKKTAGAVAETVTDPKFYKQLTTAYLSDTPFGRALLRASGV